MTERLRIRAVDEDDLQVIAACLQDALIPLREMVFMANERRFMAVFSRFRRELLPDPETADGLTLCQSVLIADQVDAVKYRGLDPEFDGVKFELLTIVAEPVDERLVRITLLFAGDVAIQLHVGRIAVILEDFGDPWPADVAPRHDQLSPAPGEGR